MVVVRLSLNKWGHKDFPKASPLGFLPIVLDIAVRGYREDPDQSAAGPEHFPYLRQGGRPDGVKHDINAFSRPVTNGLTYVFGLIVDYAVCTEASDICHIGSPARRRHQQPTALRKLHGEAAYTTGGPVYEHLLTRNHAALFRMKESLKGGQRRNGNSRRLGEIQAFWHWGDIP